MADMDAAATPTSAIGGVRAPAAAAADVLEAVEQPALTKAPGQLSLMTSFFVRFSEMIYVCRMFEFCTHKYVHATFVQILIGWKFTQICSMYIRSGTYVCIHMYIHTYVYVCTYVCAYSCKPLSDST